MIGVSVNQLTETNFNWARKISRNFSLLISRFPQDYLVNEMQVAALYTPQNQFCFIIDNKVSPDFRSQMRNLSSCFPENVHILPIEFRITSNGDNLTRSMIECVKYLLKPDIKHQWQYVILLHVLTLPAKSSFLSYSSRPI